MNDTKDIVLWVVVPYACLVVFVVGHYWRYRYDCDDERVPPRTAV